MSGLQNMVAIEAPDGEALREAFARGNALASRSMSIFGQLLALRDHSLLGEEVLARTRAMLDHVARQVLHVQAEATGQAARDRFAKDNCTALAERFFASRPLTTHCAALVCEWQLTVRMEQAASIDPVLSPVLRSLIASEDAGIAATAMAALAAQARFAQTQRRMELALEDLPGDLFHEVLMCWRGVQVDGQSDALVRAESRLRSQFDEGAGRLALLSRLTASLGTGGQSLLDLPQAGVALFLSALAKRSAQGREDAALSTSVQQMARLAIGLRAAGLNQDTAELQIMSIHPELVPPSGLGAFSAEDARQLLKSAAGEGKD